VQILVVVANIQMRTLKAEVEKGSARTAFDRRLVDPKAIPSWGSDGWPLVRAAATGLFWWRRPGCAPGHRKGIRRKFLNQDMGPGRGGPRQRVAAPGPATWQHKRTRGHRQRSWKELSFLFNGANTSPSSRPWKRIIRRAGWRSRQSTRRALRVSGAPLTVLENPREGA